MDRALPPRAVRADILDFFAVVAELRDFAVLAEPRAFALEELFELRELPLRDLAVERLLWAMRFERELEVVARPLALDFVLFLAEEALVDFAPECFLALVDVGISINLLNS